MGALRPFLGLLLAAAIALTVYGLGRRLVRHRLPSSRRAPQPGFAGWLLVLAAIQWLAVLGLLGSLVRRAAAPADPEAWLATGALIHLVLFGFVAWCAIAMMRRSPLYPRLLRAELVLLVALPPLQSLRLAETSAAYVTEPKLWIAFAVRLAATAMAAAACYLYSQHSQRMQVTFAR